MLPEALLTGFKKTINLRQIGWAEDLQRDFNRTISEAERVGASGSSRLAFSHLERAEKEAKIRATSITNEFMDFAKLHVTKMDSGTAQEIRDYLCQFIREFYIGIRNQLLLQVQSHPSSRARDATFSNRIAVEFDAKADRALQLVMIDLDKTLATHKWIATKDQAGEIKMVDHVEKGYVFIAMPMSDEFDDVHKAIKETAEKLNLNAQRVDEIQDNDKITKKIIECIRKAEFVIADLTHSKPNVFYEAGYAEALGKTPVYIARTDTVLHFDILDYPVIFFPNMTVLKNKLATRLQAIL